jgi:hypothetical protein
MKVTFVLVVLFLVLDVSAQNSRKITYIIVRVPYTYDRHTDSLFCFIDAETGNPYANELYNLVNYKIGKNVKNQNATFYYERMDTSKLFYNFFRNRTEALLFLSENNWELVSVGDDINSKPITESVGTNYFTHTLISNTPVFYLKKEIMKQ